MVKKLGEKSQRLERARADGRAIRRSSIVPADVAETFHGFSRGDATRTQHWRENRSATAELRGGSSLKCG